MPKAVIIPGILTRDAEEIYEKIKVLESIPEVSEIHLDFADGVFVQNTTVLPGQLWDPQTRLKIEAHLMVKDPHKYFHDLEHIGVKRVILQYESFGNVPDLLNAIGNLKAMGMECAVALNVGTEISSFDPVVSQIDAVVIMSIAPGFQGQPFLPETYSRLDALHKNYPDLAVQIDGAVNSANISKIQNHGVSRFTVGSGIWHSPDPKKRIYELLGMIL
jgi:ribulose-phosphate 3-epimerase